MEEQLISFETAKLAKEKGFPQNPYKIPYSYRYEFTDNTGCVLSYSLFNPSSNICTAPTQSLLAKWLREEHNIHFEIKPIFDIKDNLKPYHISVIKNPSGKDFEYEIVGSLDTYEETLEIGLQEALKLIK